MKPTIYLTEKFLHDGIIKPEEIEIVRYGLESIESNLLGFLVTLAIGSFFGHILESIVLWMLIFPLRKNAGGFHAKTKKGCLLISIGILMGAFICFLQMEWSKIMYMIITILSFGIIFFIAPVESFNKRLDMAECYEYRKRTRMILILEMLLFVLTLCFEYEMVYKMVTVCFSIVTVSLLAEKMKLYI